MLNHQRTQSPSLRVIVSAELSDFAVNTRASTWGSPCSLCLCPLSSKVTIMRGFLRTDGPPRTSTTGVPSGSQGFHFHVLPPRSAEGGFERPRVVTGRAHELIIGS